MPQVNGTAYLENEACIEIIAGMSLPCCLLADPIAGPMAAEI
jgi:hypothetical protein